MNRVGAILVIALSSSPHINWGQHKIRPYGKAKTPEVKIGGVAREQSRDT